MTVDKWLGFIIQQRNGDTHSGHPAQANARLPSFLKAKPIFYLFQFDGGFYGFASF